MRKLFFWMPLVLVGSLVYWTLAVTLGGMSLWAVWPSSSACDGSDAPERGLYQPLTVRLIVPDGPDGLFDGTDPAHETELLEADAKAGLKPADAKPAESKPDDRTSAELASSRTDVAPPRPGPAQGPGDTAF